MHEIATYKSNDPWRLTSPSILETVLSGISSRLLLFPRSTPPLTWSRIGKDRFWRFGLSTNAIVPPVIVKLGTVKVFMEQLSKAIDPLTIARDGIATELTPDMVMFAALTKPEKLTSRSGVLCWRERLLVKLPRSFIVSVSRY